MKEKIRKWLEIDKLEQEIQSVHKDLQDTKGGLEIFNGEVPKDNSLKLWFHTLIKHLKLNPRLEFYVETKEPKIAEQITKQQVWFEKDKT